MEDRVSASLQAEMDSASPSLEAAMEVPVTASLGPMGPLLRNLYSLTAPVWLTADDFRRLRDGLEVLCVALKDLSETEDASFTAKWWMKIVRELCYDAEDHLDEVIFSGAGGAHQTKHGFPFAELIARVEDARERSKRFQWPIKTIKPDRGEPGASSTSDHGGRSIIGVEPTNRLVRLLALDDDEKKLKVIPIFGVAGVGKTTVARSLYDKYGGNFQCRAFVRVSRNPDMRRLLTSMLSQIKAPQPHGFPDVTDLIDGIKKHLQGKRYFIIMNDLWTASVWDIISRAFPHGDYCSRIITTTQIYDVALACCSYYSEHIYEMSPLNDDESRKLLFGRVFGSEDSCPTPTYIKDEIIRKCGGLPLAITIIASLLPSDPNMVMEKWKHIQDSLPSTSEGMRDVLYLIYNSLPSHLKTFLLYLSMYPEGYPIGKHDLVEQWVAEGFVGAVEGQDTEETAESYFDVLVSRGMVQAVDTNYDGEVLSCTVHHMVLDLIRNKSMQENFVITVDNFQSTPALPDKVRRLSIQFGGAKGARIPESIIWSQVRSLKFCGFFECVPSIADYGLLRVLILHIWADENKIFDLSGIGELFRLRYLKIECNMTIKLPAKIGGLQYLETLEIDARILDVPSDIVHLENLWHLCLPSEANLPHGVGHMTSLRTLGYFDLGSNSEDNVMDISKLTNIQDLHLTCSTVQPVYNLESNMKCLGSIFWKLSSLKCLALVPASGSSSVNTLQGDAGASSMSISSDALSMVSPLPSSLQRLEVSWRCCIFSSLPKWIGELGKLCILKIAVRELTREDTDILKGLPALTALSLYIQTTPAERIIIDEEGFPLLRYFKFICTAPCLSFVEGAMPNVRKLKLGSNANRMMQHSLVDAGLMHLTGLREISIKLGVAGADESDRRAAESALQAAVGLHPNRDLISRVQLVDRIFYVEEDKSAATEEQEHSTLEKQHVIQGHKKRKREHPDEDVTKEIDSGIPESSSHLQNPGVELEELDYSKSSSGGVELEITGNDDLHSFDEVLASSILIKIEKLTLEKCPPLELKHVQQLTSLKTLTARGSAALVRPSGGQGDVEWQLPVEHLSIGSVSGKELTELLRHLPRLSKLEIEKCEKITQLVVGVDLRATTSAASEVEQEKEEDGVLHFPAHLSDSLRELQIDHCAELVLVDPPTLVPDADAHHNKRGGGEWLQALRSLQKLRIEWCRKFLSAWSFSSPSSRLFPSSLQHLRLWGVEGMETLEPLSNLTSLTRLEMGWCEYLRCEGLLPLTTGGQLTQLRVFNCPRFFAGLAPNPSRVLQDGGEAEHQLQLQEISTNEAAGLLAAPICSLLSSSLTKLCLWEMERFSKEQEDALHLLASLQELQFFFCSELQHLPAGLHKLTNLKRLEVSECPAVRSLPKDGLPKSLQELDVYGCGNEELTQQCRGLVGTIPRIRLD